MLLFQNGPFSAPYGFGVRDSEPLRFSCISASFSARSFPGFSRAFITVGIAHRFFNRIRTLRKKMFWRWTREKRRFFESQDMSDFMM
jgi:hypothetical protein